MVDGLLKFCPPERLLYGSDAPGRSFFPQIRKILERALTVQERELVFWRNALKIFRVPEPPPCEEIQMGASLPLPPGQEEDHFCFCGKYPFDRRPIVTPREWESLLAGLGVEVAYTAAFECIFHIDLLESNQDFLEQCAGLQRVRPLAVVNPCAHNWSAVLDQVSSGAFAGAWVSPVLHCWNLAGKSCHAFFLRCAELGIPVWINCGFGEARFFHVSQKIRPLEDSEIRDFLECAPRNAYVFQGRIPPAGLPQDGNCRWVLSALTDFPGKLEAFLRMENPPELVWGSEFPFRTPDSVRDCVAASLSHVSADFEESPR